MRKPKLRLWSVLALSLLLLSSCQYISRPPEQLLKDAETPDSVPAIPADAPANKQNSESVTLWFRYDSEAVLASESRTIVRSLNEPRELSILRALTAGPDIRNSALSGVFPEGTTVISTSLSNRILYVTFSAELMNAYADEPESWQSDTYWSREKPLRRELCMQSLIATMTDNCEVDRIQVFLQDRDGNTRRMPQSYYPGTGSETLPANLIWRDDRYLWTPGNAARTIMSILQQRDWERLYRFICVQNPQTGESRPDYADFTLAMERTDPLVSCQVNDISVSEGGDKATFTFQAQILSGGGQTESLDSHVLHLYREGGAWKALTEQLINVLEVRYE